MVRFALRSAKSESDKYLESSIELIEKTTYAELKIETTSKYHGKEIDGYFGKLYLNNADDDGSAFIFKRAKNDDIDFDLKIRIQLIAQDLANEFSKLFFVLI